MEEEKKLSQDDLFEKEEKCQKTIRVVRKAIVMRLVLAALMIWVVSCNPQKIWAWGLMVFMLIVDLGGTFPLWKELRKQKLLLNELIDQEEK